MATLIDPAIAADDHGSVAERLEAVARGVMAARCRLKGQPGTHGEQADLVLHLDAVLDRYCDLTCREPGHRH